MTREDSIRQIENYPPFNEQEEKDKALILGWIRDNENAFSRKNTVAHITASAWLLQWCNELFKSAGCIASGNF